MPAAGHHGGVRDGSCGANRGSATDGGARRLCRRGWDADRAEPVCGTGSSPRDAVHDVSTPSEPVAGSPPRTLARWGAFRGATCRSSSSRNNARINRGYSSRAKTKSESPDTVATYCLLPTRYVIGPLLIAAPRFVFHSSAPVRASSA